MLLKSITASAPPADIEDMVSVCLSRHIFHGKRCVVTMPADTPSQVRIPNPLGPTTAYASLDSQKTPLQQDRSGSQAQLGHRVMDFVKPIICQGRELLLLRADLQAAHYTHQSRGVCTLNVVNQQLDMSNMAVLA